MNKPQRQHPAWVLYQMGKLGKDLAIPVIIALFLILRHESLFSRVGISIALIILLYELISILFRWKNNTYQVHGRIITLTEGRFIRKTRYIALDKIHNIHERTTYLHKLFQTSALILQTGTNKEDSSIKLEMIPTDEVKQIHKLMERTTYSRNDIKTTSDVIIHYNMNWKEIILISITSLYIIALFPIVLSIYFKLNEVFSIHTYANEVGAFITHSWGMITFTFILISIIAIGTGILFTYLRFGNYEVASDQEHIYIKKGIIQTSHFTIPRNKVNGIVIEKSLTRRIFNIVKVRLISVNNNILEDKLETDILFPFIRTRRGYQLIEDVFPQYRIEEEMNILPRQAYFVELIQPNFSLVIVTFFIYFFWPEFWFVPIVYVLYIIIKRILTTYQQRFIWRNNHTQIQSGSFSVSLKITERQKIDALVIDQSWIERKLGLASIRITSRANPLHVAKAERMRTNDAEQFYHWYRQK